MAFQRIGETIQAFSSCTSFNFDGNRAVRRHLRKLRKEGVGENKYVTFQLQHLGGGEYYRRDIRCTSQSRKIAGRAFRHEWVCNNAALRLLILRMPFRCPRCYSDKRPSAWIRPEVRVSYEDTLSSIILCDACEQMNEVSNLRQACRAVLEITALQRELKHLQRKIK